MSTEILHVSDAINGVFIDLPCRIITVLDNGLRHLGMQPINPLAGLRTHASMKAFQHDVLLYD